MLAPRPSTPQWRVAVEPRHGAHAGKLCVGPRAEYRVIVEEDIYPVLDAVGQRPRVIDLHLEHGTRDIVLGAGQRLSLAVNQMVGQRKIGVLCQAVGTADRDDRPTLLHEFHELRYRLAGGDTSELAAVFLRNG